jgi:hypothetical protein
LSKTAKQKEDFDGLRFWQFIDSPIDMHALPTDSLHVAKSLDGFDMNKK